MPRLRNFDTKPLPSYCYEFQPNDRLESVAHAHTAADLHVRPWFSNRADLESHGRRERLRNTSCLISRNGNDSTQPPAKSTSRSQNRMAACEQSDKVLNLYEDSKRCAVVTFRVVAQNKFINCLRLSQAKTNFRTSHRHYADK
jgi:hypothetical protein